MTILITHKFPASTRLLNTIVLETNLVDMARYELAKRYALRGTPVAVAALREMGISSNHMASVASLRECRL